MRCLSPCLVALCIAACGLCGCAAPLRSTHGVKAESPGWAAGSDFDWGFLGSRDTTVDGSRRRRWLGPLVEEQYSPTGMVFTAVRPFVSGVWDSQRDRQVREVLWPLAAGRRLEKDASWRVLTAYGNIFDCGDPQTRYRSVIFPFVFWGRSAGGDGYFAVFPVGGTIHEYIGMDRIDFALFPLYARTIQDDLRSHSILWPICSWARGDDVKRLRVFPLYARSENRDRWVKRFVCWPFWSQTQYLYPEEKGTAWVAFPFVGRIRTAKQSGWLFLPPIFRHTRRGDTTLMHCPWPFFQYRRGPNAKMYLWPLLGYRQTPNLRSGFVLWPIASTQRTHRREYTQRRASLFPFFFYEARRPPPKAEKTEEADAPVVLSRFVKIWPLYSYWRDGGSGRIRLLALWPPKHTASIERNYAPLWELYATTWSPTARETEILWGMVRQRSGSDGSRHVSVFPVVEWGREATGTGTGGWSILKGLVGYRRQGLQKEFRILYFLRFQRREQREGSVFEVQ